MLGHCLTLELSKHYEVLGIARKNAWSPLVKDGYDISQPEKIEKLIQDFKPQFIINAVGIIKQLKEASDKLLSIQVNAMWPHQLSLMAARCDSRVIHFSTDCVFRGDKGNYSEADIPDARDLYGLTKYLGELDSQNCLTLRTSIIGHEIASQHSLIDWFLSQSETCQGYQHAIYSGLPTVSVAKFLHEYVFKKWVSGLYHLSSEPISKYDLLALVAARYQKGIEIVANTEFCIDRSLNSDRLRKELDYNPASWPELVDQMYSFYIENRHLYEEKA